MLSFRTEQLGFISGVSGPWHTKPCLICFLESAMICHFAPYLMYKCFLHKGKFCKLHLFVTFNDKMNHLIMVYGIINTKSFESCLLNDGPGL